MPDIPAFALTTSRGFAGWLAATGGSLAFTFCGVLFGPPAFAFLVEGGVSYASAFVLLALPAVACGLWLLWSDGFRNQGRHPAAR